VEVIGGCIDLLIRQSGIGGIGIEGRLCSAMYPSSMKEQVEPESRKERKERSNCSQIRGGERESGVTTAFSCTAVSAQGVLESWLALLLTIYQPLSTGHCAQYR